MKRIGIVCSLGGLVLVMACLQPVVAQHQGVSTAKESLPISPVVVYCRPLAADAKGEYPSLRANR